MQTLFVVKVSYFGLRQFTRNPTTWEGVRKEGEEVPNGDTGDGDDRADHNNPLDIHDDHTRDRDTRDDHNHDRDTLDDHTHDDTERE